MDPVCFRSRFLQYLIHSFITKEKARVSEELFMQEPLSKFLNNVVLVCFERGRLGTNKWLIILLLLDYFLTR